MAPKDLIVIKAITADVHVPDHWWDALGLLVERDVDWPYLLRRARRHVLRRTTPLDEPEPEYRGPTWARIALGASGWPGPTPTPTFSCWQET